MSRAVENQYRQGARPLIRATFTDEDGNPFAPTTHKLTVRPPKGALIVFTDAVADVADPSTLAKRLDPVSEPGRWHYRFEGDDGAHFAVDESSFYVQASEV